MNIVVDTARNTETFFFDTLEKVQNSAAIYYTYFLDLRVVFFRREIVVRK